MGERIDFLIGPWRDWRLPKPYQCEVCGKRLNRRHVVEIAATSPGERPDEGGGIIATYCKRAPHCIPTTPKNEQRIAEIAAALERAKERA